MSVVLHAPDNVVHAGLVSYLQHDRRVRVLPAAKIEEADVIVVAVDVVDASTLKLLRGLRNTRDARFVMVAERAWQVNVSEAVNCGVHAVLWRDAFTPASLIHTLRIIADGGGSLPQNLQRTLMEEVRWTQRELLAPLGLTAFGVSHREVDVLRLISEGKELSEIATELSYSERTVKYTLYGMMKRLQLRNRAHAVAYAIRAGII